MSRRQLLISIIVFLFFGLTGFTITTIHNAGQLVWSDGLPYFLYARSAVLDHDTDITNEYDELDARYPSDSTLMVPLRDWTRRDPETSRIVAPWPVGAGLVMTPFYALGYAVELVAAKLSGRAPDSYGLITQYFFCTGSLAFGLLAFWSMFLCARAAAGANAALLATLGVLLGGPAVFYIFVNPSMAHASSLGLISLLTLLWFRQWQDRSTHVGMALLGLVLGIAFTVRYQNALFGLLPLTLWLKEMRRLPARMLLTTGLAGLAGLLAPVSVQLMHLHVFGAKTVSLNPVQDGVAIGGYPFDLSSPYFFDVLFSARHGAFHWAPVLALGFIGLLWAARNWSWAWPMLITFLANVYLIGALGMANSVLPADPGQTANWENHWNGAPAFGMRYLTECAPFFAAGLAVLIQSSERRMGKLFWPTILSVAVVWNGLLILAYGLETMSRSYSLSYADMFRGVYNATEHVLERALK